MSSARFGRRLVERRGACSPAVPNLDQGAAMLSHTSRLAVPAALALLVGGLACSDRTPGTGPAPGPAGSSSPGSSATGSPAPPAPPEQLARALALALADPAFRARVHAQLAGSPSPRPKPPVQRFPPARGRDALPALGAR